VLDCWSPGIARLLQSGADPCRCCQPLLSTWLVRISPKLVSLAAVQSGARSVVAIGEWAAHACLKCSLRSGYARIRQPQAYVAPTVATAAPSVAGGRRRRVRTTRSRRRWTAGRRHGVGEVGPVEAVALNRNKVAVLGSAGLTTIRPALGLGHVPQDGLGRLNMRSTHRRTRPRQQGCN